VMFKENRGLIHIDLSMNRISYEDGVVMNEGLEHN
jgi:hypothetical protein